MVTVQQDAHIGMIPKEGEEVCRLVVTQSSLHMFGASSSSPNFSLFCPSADLLERMRRVASLNIVLTPLMSITLSTSAYDPVQKHISTPGILIEFLMIFPSKQAQFRAWPKFTKDDIFPIWQPMLTPIPALSQERWDVISPKHFDCYTPNYSSYRTSKK
jgi:hypothetical protein